MNRRGASLICLLAILVLAIAGCGESTQASEATTKAKQADSQVSLQAHGTQVVADAQGRGTQVVAVAPVDESNQPVAGLKIEAGGVADICSAGSDGIGNAYKCFARSTIYDPCWRDDSDPSTLAVLCQLQPWDKRVFRLTLKQPSLEPFHSRPWKVEAHQPWGVELTTGERCTTYGGGSHGFIPRPGGVRVIDYYCGNRAGEPDKPVLLRGIDRSRSRWTIDSATLDRRLGPTLGIVTAWYATQEPATPKAQKPNSTNE